MIAIDTMRATVFHAPQDISVEEVARPRPGWVTLNGELSWHYQRMAAEHDVHNVAGVRGLTNKISIKPHVSHVQSSAVREKIAKALARTAALDAAGISIQTDDGDVTLTGKVPSWSERNLVEDAAWSVPGVTEVNDKLGIGAWASGADPHVRPLARTR